jgi:hypothetical protein
MLNYFTVKGYENNYFTVKKIKLLYANPTSRQ